jgi:putative radical SAM enzyme (TIGR03279 family)
MVTIKSVKPRSPAQKSGIKSGEMLVSLNGNKINDVLDYGYYSNEKHLTIGLLSAGTNRELIVKKGEYEDLGLEFDSFLMSEKQSCKNKCVFCFIDQLPKGMRETLYFKDDDARLSFLQGNYITLTNLSDSDIDRIIQMKLTVNISVHTTNPELRCRMLNNRFAGESLRHLRRMGEAGIRMNCQIVLCPGMNDGDELRRTLTDLTAIDSVESIAVVPVGLTKHRADLPPLKPFDRDSALEALKIANAFTGVCCADELFLIAGKEIPGDEYYGDYPQYENGVGMWRSLVEEFTFALSEAEKPRSVKPQSIVTGAAAYPLMCELSGTFSAWAGCETIPVFGITNAFFGESVNCSGLVTGGDIIAQLSDKKLTLGERLLIPQNMLKSGENLFLDDVTVDDVSAALSVSVRAVAVNGEALLNALLEVD